MVFFAGQFFPAENRALALIGATSAYALAFFFRPLGGILLGRFADLRGRKAGMLLTILLMAGGSMVIAILPTYEQVGWLAPILLLLARIAQGMSLGGEVSNASPTWGRSPRRTTAAGTRRSSTSPPAPRCWPPSCSACC